MRLSTLPLVLAALPLAFSQPEAQAASSQAQALKQRIATQLGVSGPEAAQVAERAAQLVMNSHGSSLLYVVRASEAGRNRQVTGPVNVSVDGVPAEPVDSGVFDGVGHEKLPWSSLWMVLDPASNEGTVWVRWFDSHGFWSLIQTVHAPPPHPTALRIAPDAGLTEFITDGLQTHGYQHGNTGAGGPIMPTIFQHLASFGPAQVTLNGRPFLNPFPGATAPDWFGAIKVSDGVRSSVDGTIRNTSGGIFSPMNPADGATDANDLEVQCIFHDDAVPPPGNMANFPARHRFFYWLNFEEVTIQTLNYE